MDNLPGEEERVAAGLGVDDGDEDLVAVGAAFSDWVEQNGLETSKL